MATVTATPAQPPLPAPLAWTDLLPHRAPLVRYARRQLHDPSLAEDLVHDVFEAVMTGRAAFGGRAALRTWLVGILRHKIVDLVRQRAPLDSLDDGDDDLATGAAHQLESPQPHPDEVASSRQLLAQVLARIERLPETLRSVVELRLLHDQDSDQVCRALGIHKNNLFVRLHRARQLLAA